jgi:hypothetical protein
MCSLADGFSANMGLTTGWECSPSGLIPNTSVCTWTGVTCVDDKVTEIDVNTKGIEGTIATEIGLLNSVSILYLYDNTLNGSLPFELFLLTNLKQLRIQNN